MGIGNSKATKCPTSKLNSDAISSNYPKYNIKYYKHSGKICAKCNRLCFYNTNYCYMHGIQYDQYTMDHYIKKIKQVQNSVTKKKSDRLSSR